MSSHPAWKKVERRICRKLGGERNPLSGSNSRITAGDCIHDKFFVEVKHRSRIPFLKNFNEMLDKAQVEKKIPMMVIHEKGKKSSIVMIRLEEFIDLISCSF